MTTDERTGTFVRVPQAPVVVGYREGATGEAAIAAAAREARVRNTRLLVMHQLIGDERPDRFGPDAAAPEPRAAAMYGLMRTAHTAAPGLDHIDVEVVTEPIVDALLSRSCFAALLVLGVTPTNATAAALFDAVPRALVSKSHCPVMLVNAEATLGEELVCGVDRSPNCTEALRWAAHEAARRGTTLLAVEVLPDRERGDDTTNEKDLSRWVNEQLVAAETTVLCATRYGSPAQVLAAVAAERDAVLVIGSPHRASGQRVKSVARAVSTQHDVAVVVVPDTWSNEHPRASAQTRARGAARNVVELNR